MAGSFSGGETINALGYRPSAPEGIVSKDPKPVKPHAKTVDVLRYETGRRLKASTAFAYSKPA